MKLKLTRLYQQPVGSPKQTIGELYVIAGNEIISKCYTLELPWLANDRRISCIPAGEYQVVERQSPKYGKHWHLLNVPSRELILIHSGNYHTHTLGCILVGSHLADMNNDGLCDVANSAATMNKLRAILPTSFNIEIEWRS